MRKIAKRIVIGLGLLVILLSLFIRPFPFQGYYEGFVRHRLIASEINGALRVTAIEHTEIHDVIDNWDQYQEKILQTKVLSANEIQKLLEAIPAAEDGSDNSFLSCGFYPHHRIEIERQDHSVFVWEICFTCGEHQLPNDRNRILPEGWETSLASFFKGIGMDPEIHKRKL
ncbi:hypothetical protein BH11VER1_BH11VER1_25010 [soil metagenome]